MNNKLKETFDNIHAEEKLKEQTKVFIADKSKNYTKLQKKLAYKDHSSGGLLFISYDLF